MKPVSSLRIGSILPSWLESSSSRAVSKRVFSSLPYEVPKRRSERTIPLIPTRLYRVSDLWLDVKRAKFDILAGSIDPIGLTREKTVIVFIPIAFDCTCNFGEVVFILVFAVNLKDHRSGCVVASIASVGLINTNSLKDVS